MKAASVHIPASKDVCVCSHCGDDCPLDHPTDNGDHFCCHGCKTVWDIIHQNNLAHYYTLNEKPGIKSNRETTTEYDFLDDADLRKTVVAFQQGNMVTLFLELPDIHCTACVWLLENLSRLNKGVIQSRVNFLEKKATIVVDEDSVSLKALCRLLDKLGYPPRITADKQANPKSTGKKNKLIAKIGLAGFCFGNIMLLSFPDYLGDTHQAFFRHIAWIKLGLAIPVLVYSASDYFKSAWHSLLARNIGIDIPVVIGMLTLFLRSLYEVITHTGIGYFDSLAGFVLFLLIGRWYQQRIYRHISFDRDYTSFFPLSVKKKVGDSWKDIRIEKVGIGDILLIRSGEIIPCESILLSEKARVDYSFITGESQPVAIHSGETISAGGKLNSAPCRISVTALPDESKISELWKNDVFNQRLKPSTLQLLDKIGSKFTLTILAIALVNFIFWYMYMPAYAFQSTTAVLIIACPCVLALSFPFLYGNALRLLSTKGIYLKNTDALYDLSSVDTIIFDKTGTLTDTRKMTNSYSGMPLSHEVLQKIKGTCLYSTHPLSRNIFDSLNDVQSIIPDSYKEHPGKGIEATFGSNQLRLGSADFTGSADNNISGPEVSLSLNGKACGKYTFSNAFRPAISKTVRALSHRYQLGVVSGDNDRERNLIDNLFEGQAEMYFNQLPQQKLDRIKQLQDQSKQVLMIGDGLNDAGALKQSNVSMVLAHDHHFFTPASDIIVSHRSVYYLDSFLAFAKTMRSGLYVAFLMAFIYNFTGLAFAVTAKLTPVVAAILMPISSISIVLFGLLYSTWVFRRMLKSPD